MIGSRVYPNCHFKELVNILIVVMVVVKYLILGMEGDQLVTIILLSKQLM